ncbi:hypothetical protein [Enterococcus sp. AZ109]|uniref:hypothetical protein n=1 Tax=Enterococcus sp. AZ109 TaxID=2774634 RepID=UPI003F6862F1
MELLNTLLSLINTAFSYVIDNWIAIAALAASFIAIKQESITLDFDPEGRSRWVKAIILDDGQSIVNDYGIVHTNIRIINRSNYDISYFDLKVSDGTNPCQLQYYHTKSFNVITGLKDRHAISFFDSNDANQGIDLPDGDFGILKAHSVTSIDIMVSPEEGTESLFIMLKVAKKRSLLRKPKQGYINSPYQSYSALVPVDKSLKPDYQELTRILQN